MGFSRFVPSVAWRTRQSSDVNVTGAGATYQMPVGVALIDTYGVVDIPNDRVIIPYSGVYKLGAYISMDNVTAANISWFSYMSINGASFVELELFNPSQIFRASDGNLTRQVESLVELQAGDLITGQLNISGGASDSVNVNLVEMFGNIVALS